MSQSPTKVNPEISCQEMEVKDTPKDTLVKEGKAEIFQPASVFYNPVQEFNRDLTIAVISEFAKDHIAWKKEIEAKQARHAEKKEEEGKEEKAFAATGVLGETEEKKNDSEPDVEPKPGVAHPQGLRILEGLSASGLRSVRFALEIPGVKEIVANDFDSNAVEYIRRNIQHNKVSSIVRESLGDANMVMYANREQSNRYDVIDLDPYGSPSQFLDAAVRSIRNGGLLCVTCTDMGPLCGASPETCHSKYGSMPIKGTFCHEGALRIILRSIESHANRYARYIEPVLSLKADFYIRVFVKVHTGQVKVKDACTKLSMLYHCGGCGAFRLQPLGTKITTEKGGCRYAGSQGPPVSERCDQCNSHHRLGGPYWTAPIHNTDFICRVLAGLDANSKRFGTAARIRGVLTMMTEELQDVPLYYEVDGLAKALHVSLPKYEQIRSALLNAGYRVSDSHCTKFALKTDAPPKVIFDIMRCWAKLHPPHPKRVTEGSVVKNILDKPCELEADFSLHPLAEPASRANNLLRFQENPTRDWGPKARAKRAGQETLDELRSKGQEKAKSKRQKKDAVDFKQYICKRQQADGCALTEDTCKYSHSDTNKPTKSNDISERTDGAKTKPSGENMDTSENVPDIVQDLSNKTEKCSDKTNTDNTSVK